MKFTNLFFLANWNCINNATGVPTINSIHGTMTKQVENTGGSKITKSVSNATVLYFRVKH